MLFCSLEVQWNLVYIPITKEKIGKIDNILLSGSRLQSLVCFFHDLREEKQPTLFFITNQNTNKHLRIKFKLRSLP